MPDDKIYKYYFYNIATPIEIQASNRRSARACLIKSMPFLGENYKKSKVVAETVTKLLCGVSSRIDSNGLKYIWVGLDMTKTGWQIEKEVEEIAKKYFEKKGIIEIGSKKTK